VQHHHAHLASCLGEHLWPRDGGPVAGIILDGLGLGTDGTIWGGEVLLGDYAGVERIAWLRPVPLPGGDAANREPWRNALARLDAARGSPRWPTAFAGRPLGPLRHAMAEGMNAPLSSSAGRLFDAFAAVWASTGRRASRARRRWGWRRSPARRGCGPPRPTVSAIPARGGAMDDTGLWQERPRDLATARARGHGAPLSRRGRPSFALQARHLVEMAAPARWRFRGAVSRTRFFSTSRSKALDGVPVMHHTQVSRPMTAGLRSGRRWWPWQDEGRTVTPFPVWCESGQSVTGGPI
jgi:hydrogenase maturation protein HypF